MKNSLQNSPVLVRFAVFTFSAVMLQVTARAQAPAWQTALASTGSNSTITATATDASGNVYVAGFFSRSFTLGSFTLATNASVNDSDAFVAKWSPVANRFVWAYQAGGDGIDAATGLAVSGSDVYLAGSFRSNSASFGALSVPNTTGTTGPGASNASDGFVAKLTDAGSTASFSWVQKAGGSGDELVQGLCSNGAAVYAVGTFSSATARFGNLTLANPSATTYSAFVTKLTDAGTTADFTWAERMGGTGGYDQAQAVAVSGTDVYVAGGFQSPTASFGGTILTKFGTSGSDAFVAKMVDAGTSGSFSWARQAGGTAGDLATALAVSSAGVYVAGTFASINCAVGPVSLVNASPGLEDGFVFKLTTTGNFSWGQRFGGTGGDFVRNLAASGSSLYMTGSFNGPTAEFGPTTLNNSGANGSDVFVAKLSDAGSSGSFGWALSAGGPGEDRGNALALVGSSVFVAGQIGAPATFGNVSLPANAGWFLATLRDNALLATAAPRVKNLTIYPVPAHNALHVPGVGPGEITLLDHTGRTVRRWGNQLQVLDVADLPRGAYVLRVLSAAGVVTKQVVLN